MLLLRAFVNRLFARDIKDPEAIEYLPKELYARVVLGGTMYGSMFYSMQDDLVSTFEGRSGPLLVATYKLQDVRKLKLTVEGVTE